MEAYFKELNFRRFQIDLREVIEMDDSCQMDRLAACIGSLGRMILNDRTDPTQGISPKLP